MPDPFASYAQSPEGPYSRAVELTPVLGEFEPTLAVFVNCQGLLTVKFAGDSEPVSMWFDYACRGLHKFRIKQVLSFTLEDADQFVDGSEDVPAVVGLY